METTVYAIDGKQKGTVALPPLFETKISPALLHEVVTGLRANQRAGTHNTKTRGEVSGGGRKPWKEKGTGNARAGSNRSPLWRKGGIIFGPRPHGYYQNISQQKRVQSLCMALTAKAKGGDLVVVDDVAVAEAKTKLVAGIIEALKLEGKTVLMAVVAPSAVLKRACRNYPGLVLEEARNLNTYQVLWANKLVITTAALAEIARKGQ